MGWLKKIRGKDVDKKLLYLMNIKNYKNNIYSNVVI